MLRPNECTCAAKDMTFGRCCKVTPNGVYDQDAGWGAKVEPLCRLSDATAVIDQLRAENAELVVALKLCKLNVIELCQTHGYPLPEYTLELTDKALAKHRGYATQPIDKP